MGQDVKEEEKKEEHEHRQLSDMQLEEEDRLSAAGPVQEEGHRHTGSPVLVLDS